MDCSYNKTELRISTCFRQIHCCWTVTWSVWSATRHQIVGNDFIAGARIT